MEGKIATIFGFDGCPKQKVGWVKVIVETTRDALDEESIKPFPYVTSKW